MHIAINTWVSGLVTFLVAMTNAQQKQVVGQRICSDSQFEGPVYHCTEGKAAGLHSSWLLRAYRQEAERDELRHSATSSNGTGPPTVRVGLPFSVNPSRKSLLDLPTDLSPLWF